MFQVYEEKGYEDGAYDHRDTNEYGRAYQDYNGRLPSRPQARAGIRKPSDFTSRTDVEESEDYNEEFTDRDRERESAMVEDEIDHRDDGESDYEYVTVPTSSKEMERPKQRTGFRNLSDKDMEEFKKDFEKEWKNFKINPALIKGWDKWIDGKVKPVVQNKITEKGRNPKKKDKYNAFKYKPIKVPHTKIQGLGPFRPLVVGGKVIYPGMLAKNRKPYVLPIKVHPDKATKPNFSRKFISDDADLDDESRLASSVKPTSSKKRTPTSARNNANASPSQYVSDKYRRPFSTFSLRSSPLFSKKRDSSINQRNDDRTRNSTPGLGRADIKYSVTHYTAPQRKQSYEPKLKTRQQRIKDLEKELNSEKVSKTQHRPGSPTKTVGRMNFKNRDAINVDRKYPFFRRVDDPVISEDSPLNFARNPKLRPNKKSNKMVIYSDDESDPCEDPKFPENIQPKNKELGGSTAGGPRATAIADSIKCFKKKYFGDNPLDNPLLHGVVKKPEGTLNVKMNEKINYSNNGERRTKRDVDLARYHVVLTRQSRRPSYDYGDTEDIDSDTKSEHTSYSDTKTERTTIAETSTATTTLPPVEVSEEVTSLDISTSTESEVKQNHRVVAEKRNDYGSSEENASEEKVIPIITRPLRRIHIPRHAYSSRYLLTSSRRPSTAPEPKLAQENKDDDEITTTAKRMYTTTTERPVSRDNKETDKKMAFKRRIKFLTPRPVKFSLLPGNVQESVEKIRTTTTTTEEPSTTSEAATSTTRMYPPKRKILKLRKGPFNIFSVLNESKSSPTKFPLTNYYNEAKMSSSEMIETYEEHDGAPSVTVSEEQPKIERRRRIRMRRPVSSLLREEIPGLSSSDDSNGAETGKANRIGTEERKKYGADQKERAVEVEFHQVLVQKIEPIEELNNAMPPLNMDLTTITSDRNDRTSNSSPESDQTAGPSIVPLEFDRRPDNDSLVYSVNADTGAGSWRKYKLDKTYRSKARKRIQPAVETTTPQSSTQQSEIFEDESLHQQQLRKEQDHFKRRRFPTKKFVQSTDKEFSNNQVNIETKLISQFRTINLV